MKVWIKTHLVIASTIAALVVAGAAAAAWLTYTWATGTAGGSFASTSTATAISFSTGGPGTNVVPCTAGTGDTCTGGTPGLIQVQLTNNDSGNPHAAVSPTVTLTSSGSGCAAHLFVTGTSGLTQTVAAGGTGSGSVAFVADPSTPSTCGSASITATITGSTT